MQSTVQDQHHERNASIADDASRLPQRHELQVVNPLQKTYRLRYLVEYTTPVGRVTGPRAVYDRLRNPYVTLKVR